MELKRFRFYLIICLVLMSIVTLWALGLRQLINDVELVTYDWRTKLSTDTGYFNSMFKKANKDIILINIDDYCFQNLSKNPQLEAAKQPWPRKVWGDIIGFINKGNPKAIVLNIKFEGTEDAYINNSNNNYFIKSLNNRKIVHEINLTYPRYDEVDNIYKTFSSRNIIDNLINKNELDETLSRKYFSVIYNVENDLIRKKLKINVDDSSILSPDLFFETQNRLFNNITYYGYFSVLPLFLENIRYIGAINQTRKEKDNVIRYHVPLLRLILNKETMYIPSLPLATVLSILPEQETKPFKIEKNKIILGRRIIPIDDDGKFLINWHGLERTYNYISIARIILTDAYNKGKIKNLDKTALIDPSEFKDKIVVIGITTAGSNAYSTPMGWAYPGPEIVATTIDNLLNDTLMTPDHRKFIAKAPLWLDILFLLIFCIAIGSVNIKIKSHIFGFAWYLLIMSAFVVGSTLIFANPELRIWINISYPVIFMTLTAIGTSIYKIYTKEKDRKEVKDLFGKFVSPQILDKLLKDPKMITKEGRRKVITVLFADIKGFTSLSESIPAGQIVRQLNDFMTEMVEVILKYNGTLDKYIGDAIMAFYNDPISVKDHALRALLTAINMEITLNKLNDKWKREGKPALNVCIGINTGEMIVGHMGSPRFYDYTVIGDNVNLAARLQGLNKEYNTNILISESTYLHIKDLINVEIDEFTRLEVEDLIDIEYIGECTVKGKQIPVKIYKVNGLKKEISETDFNM